MKPTFFAFMENVIVRMIELKHIGTAKNYRAALNSFKRYADASLRGLRSPLDGDRKLLGHHPALDITKSIEKTTDIPLEAIDHILIEDYQEYLKSTGLSPNSISFYMRILRAVYNRAVDLELTKDRRPFRKVFTGNEKTLKRAITIKEVKKLKNLDLSQKPQLEFARDMFIFLFLCRGMSFIDAAYLKKTDIHNGVLTYRRHKTGQTLHIEIIKPIRELLDYYTCKVVDSPYLLPIITTSGKDDRKQYESTLHNVNKSLKIIGELAWLPIKLTILKFNNYMHLTW